MIKQHYVTITQIITELTIDCDAFQLVKHQIKLHCDSTVRSRAGSKQNALIKL